MTRRRITLALSIVLAVALGGAALLRAEWVYSPSTSQWTHVEAKDVDTDISDNQFQHAVAAYQSGDYTEASRIIEGWLRFYRYQRDNQQALFLLGEIRRAQGDYDAAYAAYEELLNRYAGTDLFDRTLAIETEMAQGYLDGKKRKALKVFWVTARDEGETMLEKIFQRDPHGVRGKGARVALADYHFRDNRFAEAEDGYQRLITNYPRDPDVPQWKLQAAQAALARFRGAKTDGRALPEAEQRFKQLVEEYPDLARKENVSQVLQVIDERKAEKDFDTAQFYKKTKKTKAAIFYYRAICRDYAGTLWAQRAKDELVALGADDRVDPKTPPQVRTAGLVGAPPSAGPGGQQDIDSAIARAVESRLGDESRPPSVVRVGLAPIARNIGMESEGFVIDVGEPTDEHSPALTPVVDARQVGDLANLRAAPPASQPEGLYDR
ncbi:MAG: outer membrane protein assembly factor BamD [Phycisphaerae bacterium]|nr:outer membrane protein assembly factor BamD [Phycisphaerae bacterium]